MIDLNSLLNKKVEIKELNVRKFPPITAKLERRNLDRFLKFRKKKMEESNGRD